MDHWDHTGINRVCMPGRSWWRHESLCQKCLAGPCKSPRLVCMSTAESVWILFDCKLNVLLATDSFFCCESNWILMAALLDGSALIDHVSVDPHNCLRMGCILQKRLHMHHQNFFSTRHYEKPSTGYDDLKNSLLLGAYVAFSVIPTLRRIDKENKLIK